MGAHHSKTIRVTNVETNPVTNRTTQSSSTKRPSRFRSLRASSSSSSSLSHFLSRHFAASSEDSGNESYRFSDGRRFNDSSKNANNTLNSTNDGFTTFATSFEYADKFRTQHSLFKRMWGASYSAPLKLRLRSGGAKVLDVGCGIGSWTLEMAREFPSTTFTGVDVAPVFPPPSNKKPLNARFLQCDILDGLPFTDETFDFVYMRQLMGSFTERELEDKVFKELLRVTKPGGWIEITEVDNELVNQGPIAQRLTNALLEYYQSKGIVTSVSTAAPKIFESDTQFTNIQKLEKTCFLGKWAGKVGHLAIQDVVKSWKTMKFPISQTLGVGEREYDEIIRSLHKELENSPRTLLKTWRFYGQKSFPKLSSPADIYKTY